MRLAAAFAFASLVALGCTSPSPSGPSCTDYTPPASFDAQNPTVSFSKDVTPIFRQSCAFSTCHGASTGTANGVYLGSDSAKVYASLTGPNASELPTMPFVTPGDPRQSFLMRKMDGSQCALDAQCTGGTCQSPMPKNDVVLPVATRDVVRRWIAQGAKND